MTARRMFIKRFETGADKEFVDVFMLKEKYRLKKRGRLIVLALKFILKMRFVCYRLPKKRLLEKFKWRKRSKKFSRRLRLMRLKQGGFCATRGFILCPPMPPFPSFPTPTS